MTTIKTIVTSTLHRLGSSLNSVLRLSTGCLLLATMSTAALAQHQMHNMSPDVEGVVTMPENNAVLAAAPDSVMLHFEADMRLVKLVLKDADANFVDIGFRYRPVAAMHFMHDLPALDQADYYTVEWAVLDAEGMLVKGNFYFSFGDNAMPPSHYLEQMEHPIHIMAPDYRLL